MNHYRYLVHYHNQYGPHRLAPFYLWAETEELAIAYAVQWVGPPQAGEVALAYFCPTQALATA
jgi:hypothetical protein